MLSSRTLTTEIENIGAHLHEKAELSRGFVLRLAVGRALLPQLARPASELHLQAARVSLFPLNSQLHSTTMADPITENRPGEEEEDEEEIDDTACLKTLLRNTS